MQFLMAIAMLVVIPVAAMAQVQGADPEYLNAVVQSLQNQRETHANADAAVQAQLREQLRKAKAEIEDLKKSCPTPAR